MIKKIRYAVVGLGHLAQAAILPAFKNARKNSELAALVSNDKSKRQKLGKYYKIKHVFDYDSYDDCLKSGEIDAVYIVLPNHLHRDYTVRAAEAGIHVLCEKPLAVTVTECEQMIATTEANHVKLMTAYRLHLEEATLKAADDVRSGRLGDVKYFISTFSMQASDGVRLKKNAGGGPLYDIGVYCINAARMFFAAEPLEVQGWTANSGDPRFAEVEESFSALLRFPGDRLATFTCSFGAEDTAEYRLVGTKGYLRADPGYYYGTPAAHYLTIGNKTKNAQISQPRSIRRPAPLLLRLRVERQAA